MKKKRKNRKRGRGTGKSGCEQRNTVGEKKEKKQGKTHKLINIHTTFSLKNKTREKYIDTTYQMNPKLDKAILTCISSS